MKVAVIPARGGSKRIPRKNAKLFCGAPLISYSIKIANDCGIFDHVIVSTDDDDIANISIQNGAKVPFTRPEYLSGDHVGTMDVIKHATKFMCEFYQKPSQVCCIYPTAPFLCSEDIVESLGVLVNENLNYVFSASTFDYPIQRAIRINGRNVEMVSPEYMHTRSQDLEEVYHDAGQFYWGTGDAWLQGLEVFSNNSKIYRVPRYRTIDIDTEEDWLMAEIMFYGLNQCQ